MRVRLPTFLESMTTESAVRCVCQRDDKVPNEQTYLHNDLSQEDQSHQLSRQVEVYRNRANLPHVPKIVEVVDCLGAFASFMKDL